jgi:thiol:disulfide interchange protein DsbG
MKSLGKNVAKSVALLSISTMALSACGANADSASSMVNKMLKGHGTIKKEFNAVAGLKGFLVAPKSGPGQESIVYADQGGKYLFVGNIIAANGTNLSQQYFQQYVTNATAPKAFAAASKTNWFVMGKTNAPHKAYMLVEPNCSGCHMAYESLKPMIDSGQLAVRFIVVSFLKPDSEAKAAAILTAKDPAKAFAGDEQGFVMSSESGGIKPLKTVDAATKAKIQTNLNFMQNNHFPATPVLIYKTTAGKYEAQVGFPSDPKAGQAIVNSMANNF